MNKRLKQLAEQAGCKVMNDGEWYIPSATGLEKVIYTSGVGLEKFAELMVIEFTETVKQTANELAESGFRQGQSEEEVMKTVNGALAVLKGIVAKFGVEE